MAEIPAHPLSPRSMTTSYPRSESYKYTSSSPITFNCYFIPSSSFSQSNPFEFLNTPDQPPKLPSLSPRTLLLAILVFLMAFIMPTFMSRLMRPFTTTTRLGLNPESSIAVPEGAQKATIAAGCFWGVEHMYRKEFKGKGLYDARVGYIGGNTDSPSYRAVCSGRTGRM